MKLVAPNGKPSKLTAEQYRLVRTSAFKNWFGDWENDPENSSKVIDDNGEPLVVYHGTSSDFTVFEKSKRGAFGKGFYFTQDLKEAKGYGKKLLKVFVNMKKSATPQQVQDIMLSIEDYRYLEDIVVSKIITEKLIKSDFEGVIFEYPNKDKFVVALNPNQIKLADGSNTTFDGNNPDIRYADGGGLSKTPAPKSERIYGSKTNKPKSSASSSSAKSINFSEDTLQKIKNNIAKHNENYPNKKITLPVAKAVVRRGMGAYSSTHRPTISGGKPNSRVAWGLARLNAFAYKIINGKSKSGKYNQDDDLIKELHAFRYGGVTENWQYSIGGL